MSTLLTAKRRSAYIQAPLVPYNQGQPLQQPRPYLSTVVHKSVALPKFETQETPATEYLCEPHVSLSMETKQHRCLSGSTTAAAVAFS